MARKRPRAAPGVHFAPARGAAAASAGILGRLAGGDEQATRRAELLAKLARIEAEKAALAEDAVAEGGVVEVAADGALRAGGNGAAGVGKGKAGTGKARKASGKTSASKAKAKPAKAKPVKVSQRTGASRRTARPRVQSVMLSNLPGENECVRSSEISRCAAVMFCRKLIASMLRAPTGNPFSAPVLELWSEEAVPRYAEIVTHPMDLSTIKRRLESTHYLRQPGCCSGTGRTGDARPTASSSSCEIVATSPLSSTSNPSPSTLSFPALSGALDKTGSSSVLSTGCAGGAGGGDFVDLIRDDVVVTGPPTRRTGFEFDLGSFCADVRLCFNNCLLYCPSAEPLHGTARALLDKFDLDVAECPTPMPVLPERKREKISAKSMSVFAADANLLCDLTATDVTSSAVSAGSERPAKKSRGSAKGGATKRNLSKRNSAKGTSDDVAGSVNSFVDAEEVDVKPVIELPKPVVPEDPRSLKRRLEYLRQCRVRVVSRENGINDVPMTREEKFRLSVRMGHIPDDKVPALVRIIARSSNKPSIAEKDEFEIDLEKYSAVCLRELEAFVDGCVAPSIGGEAVNNGYADIGNEFDSVDEVEAEMAEVSAKLANVKAQRALASSSGGLWDDSSSSDGSSSGGSSGDESSDSDSSDDEE